MNAYSFDVRTGYFSGIVKCQLDPIRSEVEKIPIYLLPAGATFLSPPDFNEDSQIAVWNTEKWHIEELRPKSQQPEEKEGSENISSVVINIINNV